MSRVKKRIFVTGAAGFIGFHVALALKERGDEVVGYDNFNDYYSPELKRRRAALLKEKGVGVVEGDICDRPLLKELFEKHRFSHLLNLAAQAGVRYAQKHPEAYLKSNLEGFLSILETCRLFPEVKLTYASSSSVYGTNEKIPFSVSDRTDSPANLYAATKKANELMAYSYHHLYGIAAVGLRYFTVYGPWGRPDMAYYMFTESILKNEPIHIFNQGKMRRDFTYIDDVVAGTLAAIDLEAEWKVFNLGNNRPVELLTFVELLENILGKKAQKLFGEESRGEVETTFADIESSKAELGFSPSTSLEEGLPKFIEWYRDYQVI
ncbi:MAG: UDP-N-acetylglucosamine 4-epimerase [Chlamydiae bacterium]|nr:UDP-N-acetylglucosamine 4-epimerase [Chlamydiota bacterium]